MDLTAVLITGLFAGGVSCAAVQGGLLAGLIARQRRSPVGVGSGGSSAGVAGGSSVTDRAPMPSLWARVGEDTAPVAGFLAGKLVSHTVLGALLGALGGAVQLSAGTRTALQLVAGAVIIVFGLAQLGVPGFRRVVVEPPASWMRVVGGRARSQAALAPSLLGLASVLIPCGVTLSVEALALASGSAAAGAATMAVFVLGTAPLFAVLGYVFRRAARAWRGRLAVATGVVVLAMGLYTFNGGLELAGSPLAGSRVAQALAEGSAPPSAAARIEGGRQVVDVTARAASYTPSAVQARAGVPTTLVVSSQGAQGCVRSFQVPSRDVEVLLPVTGQERIDLGVLAPGRVGFSCSMGMYTGTIVVS